MAGLASRQRALLIEDWELTIADFENDRDEQGCLGPEATRLVHGGERLIQWLRGAPADPALLAVFACLLPCVAVLAATRLGVVDACDGWADLLPVWPDAWPAAVAA